MPVRDKFGRIRIGVGLTPHGAFLQGVPLTTINTLTDPNGWIMLVISKYGESKANMGYLNAEGCVPDFAHKHPFFIDDELRLVKELRQRAIGCDCRTPNEPVG